MAKLAKRPASKMAKAWRNIEVSAALAAWRGQLSCKLSLPAAWLASLACLLWLAAPRPRRWPAAGTKAEKRQKKTLSSAAMWLKISQKRKLS